MRTLRPFVLSFAQRYSEQALRVVSLVVLARLLSPEEIGVFTAGAAAVAFISVLSGFGIREYVIQAKDLSIGRRRTALGVALLSCWSCLFLIVAVVVLTPEAILGDELRAVLLVVAFGVALQPFVTPMLGVLQRQMMFGILYVISTLRVLLSVAVAIALAWWGLGALSLAWASVAEMAAGVVLAAIYRRQVPWVSPSFIGWREVFRFGATFAAINGLREGQESLTKLIVAQVLGYGALGLFSRAWHIVTLFDRSLVDAVSPVVLPLLAARVRQHRDLADVYLTKLAYLSGLAWPFFAFTALFADPIVHVLLGEQWDETTPLVRILCFSGVLLPFNSMLMPFLIALGIAGRYLPFQVLIQSTKLMLVLPLSFISLELACAGFVAPDVIKTLAAHRLLKEHVRHQKPLVWRVVRVSLLTTATSLLIPAALLLHFGPHPEHKLALLALAAVGFGLGWLAGVVVTAHPLRTPLAQGMTELQKFVHTALSGAR